MTDHDRDGREEARRDHAAELRDIARDEAAAAAPVYPSVRDATVGIARALATIDVGLLEQAIAEGDRAQAAGPILDPTLARAAGDELAAELRFLRATLTYRRELEALR